MEEEVVFDIKEGINKWDFLKSLDDFIKEKYKGKVIIKKTFQIIRKNGGRNEKFN